MSRDYYDSFRYMPWPKMQYRPTYPFTPFNSVTDTSEQTSPFLPVTLYRYLEPQETLQEGDEYNSPDESGIWKQISSCRVGELLNANLKFFYRRKVN
jgi:hypothetical protein